MVRVILAVIFSGLAWHTPAAAASGCNGIAATASPALVPSTQTALRVPPSALFTSSALDIREARSADSQTTWLLWSQAERLQPVARIEAAKRKGDYDLQWYQPAAQPALLAAQLNVGSMEHLFSWLLKQDPQHRFALTLTKKNSTRSAWLTHANALAAVAAMRSCLAAELQALAPGIVILPWQVATIAPLPSRNAHSLDVHARVHNGSGQTVSGHLSFARGSHLACGTEIQHDGSGHCTLFDDHGHEVHDHDHHARTVIMYSGMVAKDRILLPTTHVYGPVGRR
jgi:hypothetical protein